MSELLFSGRLSIPVSNNNLVEPTAMGVKPNGKPLMRLRKTDKAKTWVERAMLELKAQGLRAAPRAGPMQLECDFVFATISSDATNGVKQLEDLLKGLVWHDDCQVVRAFQSKRVVDAGEQPHVIVRVRLVDAEKVHPETLRRLAASTKANGDKRDQRQRSERTPPTRRVIGTPTPAVYRP